MQTFKIYTLGCKINQYDSQVIREQLERIGFKELDDGQKADYYVVNTCTVTNKADGESRNLIRQALRENSDAKVIATGCYAHSNAEDIKKINGLYLILDNDSKQNIVKYIYPQKNIDDNKICGISNFKGHTRAFVKIQDGCNNFCSFCKVPYVRGHSRSRDFNSVIEEVKRLSNNGYKEIVLTGICLGDYGKDLDAKIDLVDLIEELEKIEGVLRIRLSSIEAKDVTDRLIQKMKVSLKLCPHLHIPFQSGDNDILKLMHRKDTREGYIELVHKLKNSIKDIGITTDILIGFPQEDEKKFQNTLNFLKDIIPHRVHIFTFNPRDKTLLSNAKNLISQKVIEQRYAVTKRLTDELAGKFKKHFKMRMLEVLIEERKNGFWKGYSSNYLLINLPDDDGLELANQLIKVKIKNITDSKIYAECV